jgi:hypothetical protein
VNRDSQHGLLLFLHPSDIRTSLTTCAWPRKGRSLDRSSLLWRGYKAVEVGFYTAFLLITNNTLYHHQQQNQQQSTNLTK